MGIGGHRKGWLIIHTSPAKGTVERNNRAAAVGAWGSGLAGLDALGHWGRVGLRTSSALCVIGLRAVSHVASNETQTLAGRKGRNCAQSLGTIRKGFRPLTR
jgi:hypothetical protein